MNIPEARLKSFQDHLTKSTRILALCGAGLSASSGLATFRGAGGYWRNYEATLLATPGAFASNPSLVWQFYNYRRHKALQARPNPAHYALADLARKRPDFLTITQNVDGLSHRADHPADAIEFLHGSLMNLKCSSFDCDYLSLNDLRDPVCPALQLDDDSDVSDINIPMKDIPASELPHCPKCGDLLRPGVVWFGESLPPKALDRIQSYLDNDRKVDLMLVIGTSAAVYPAAGYIDEARRRGARVALINTEHPNTAASDLDEGDWFFQGDAARILPRILHSVLSQ